MGAQLSSSQTNACLLWHPLPVLPPPVLPLLPPPLQLPLMIAARRIGPRITIVKIKP